MSETVQVIGLEELDRGLGRIVEGLSPGEMGVLMRAIGYQLQSIHQRYFDKQAGPEGPWAPLSEATKKARRQGRGSGLPRILQDTGTLRGSLDFVSDDHSVTFGTNVHYGQFHQLGTEHMPARPFIGLDDEGEAEIVNTAEQYVRRLVG